MQDWRIDVAYFKRQFARIDLTDVRACCYGSLFDAAPELLDWIAAHVPLFGNCAEVLKQTKAFVFF